MPFIKINLEFSKYITHTKRPSQYNFNVDFINEINMRTSSLENTPSDGGDDDANVNQEEQMDETDYSLKSILTSFNLDNRKPKVFCCGENDNVVTKLVLNRSSPGQAVQVITSEKNGKVQFSHDKEEMKPKKMKITKPQDV